METQEKTAGIDIDIMKSKIVSMIAGSTTLYKGAFTINYVAIRRPSSVIRIVKVVKGGGVKPAIVATAVRVLVRKLS